MFRHTLLSLLCFSLPGLLFSQGSPPAANATATPASIPEEARKHFVIAVALFKDAKSADDYAQVITNFKRACELAPQWQEARYNLVLSEDAARDYSGAAADLRVYQKFKLSDAEARMVQDKLYVLDAKADKVAKERQKAIDESNSPDARLEAFIRSLNGGVWRMKKSYANENGGPWHNTGSGPYFVEIHGRNFDEYWMANNGSRQSFLSQPATVEGRQFDVREGFNPYSDIRSYKVTISEEGQCITIEDSRAFFQEKRIYQRTN